MLQDTQGFIKTVITSTIAHIRFSHPSANSLNSSLLQQLADAFRLLGNNPDVSIIVLQSEGTGAFCAGASFTELLAVSDLAGGIAFFSGFANVINAMRNCPKLIVGRIHGKAIGGGAGLAAACDYAFATTGSAVKLSEFTIGIGPFVIAPAVQRKVGVSGLAELTLAADEWMPASWAHQKGLYAKLFDTFEMMDEALEVFVAKLAAYNPEALREMKQVLWEGTQHWDTLLIDRARISGKLVLSDFTVKALAGFKAKLPVS